MMINNIFDPQHLKYQAMGIGGLEVATGFALLIFPELSYNFFFPGVSPSMVELALMAWIGSFVAGVGLSYGAIMADATRASLWFAPAVIRSLVGFYLLFAVIRGQLPIICLGISFYDIGLAGHHGLLMLKIKAHKGFGEVF